MSIIVPAQRKAWRTSNRDKQEWIRATDPSADWIDKVLSGRSMQERQV